MTTMTDTHAPVTGGVDTHKDTHVAAALDELGRVLGTEMFPATPAGYRQLLRWLRGVRGRRRGRGRGHRLVGRRPGPVPHRRGVAVIEVTRPNRQHRRRHGKSDPADAIGAARAVLAGEATGTPKSQTGAVEAIRLLRVARRSAVKARTQAANQLHAVIDTAPAELRQRLGSVNTEQLVALAARFHRCHPATPTDAAKLTLRVLARRWQALDDEITMLDAHLDELTAEAAPTLRALNGVGPQNAAALLAAAGDNPDRLRSAASFAALCGTSPIDASSGRQQRHRLNRGGDRQANCALYNIVMCRLRWHQPTKDYMARRTAQGRTSKEIIRCLKRYVAIEVHRAITVDLGSNTTRTVTNRRLTSIEASAR